MNSFKTALKNIKKSSRDYSVYFVTLIVGVAIFYMFNSIGSQNFMETITSSQSSTMKNLVTIINCISVGVAVVLGLLMVYANNFLIKRRKKEFGVYMMLGMSKKKVAFILSIETIIVGAFSLLIGLVLGVFGSQLLSIIVGKMFEADLSAYRFNFSLSVLTKTVVYFAVIFVVVLLFNAKSLSKYELIDLLNAKKSAEKKIIKNPVVSLVLFLVSFAALVFAYVEFGLRGASISKGEMVTSIFMGFFGTFGFFFGLSGFLPQLLKKFKGFYFNGLNAFVTSQFGHNLNSSAVAFSLISIMLFLAICAFSVGFSMNGYLNNRLKNATPVDVSCAYLYADTTQLLAENGIVVDELMAEYYEVPVYESPYFDLKSTVNAAFDHAQSVFPLARWDELDYVVRLSDYNCLERMYGRDELKLDADQYAVICDFDMLEELINEAIDNGNVINAGDVALTSGYDSAIYEYVIMSGMTATLGVTVVPDSLIDEKTAEFSHIGSIFVGNYAIETGDEIFEKIFAPFGDEDGNAIYSTATEVKANSVGTSVSVVFIVLYIGIIFIITSAAVIALKILSDSMDSVEKYSILKRVGADKKMRKNALFAQTMFNFVLPLVLGLIDSVFALRYASGLLKAFGMSRMFNGSVIAVFVMVIVYGAYFLVTYSACTRIVINNED